MKHLNYFYMVLAALCLATIGVLVKLIGLEVPVMTLNFLRLFFGFIMLLMVVPFIDKSWFRITKQDAKEFFLIGVVYAIALSLYTAANVFAPVQNAVLINYSYPFFVLLFGYLILREKVTVTKIVTLLIASVGLVIINPFQMGGNNMGNLLALGGAFFYGLLITEMRKEDKKHNIGDVLWFLFFASLVMLPFSLVNGFGNISQVWVYVVLLGAVSTGLAYIFYNLALEKMEAEIGSIISTIITPLVSILLAVLIIGEELSTRTLVGGSLLVISGVYLEFHKRKN